MDEKITTTIREHLDTLARKRMTTYRVDDYGVADASKWNDEVEYFLQHVVRPKLTNQEALAVKPRIATVVETVKRMAAERAAQLAQDLDYDDSMSPIEYEAYCARLLDKLGWTARATKASGDQGADVVAEKAGVVVVLQCKKYSKPVGNKAVQEVAAARTHYRARLAAVVATNDYTRSARELAQTTGVALLHHSDLLRFDEAMAAFR